MHPLGQTSWSPQYSIDSVTHARTLDIARLSGPGVSRAPATSVRSLFVVGGRHRSLRPGEAHFGDWCESESGVLLQVVAAGGTARQMVEYPTRRQSARRRIRPSC